MLNPLLKKRPPPVFEIAKQDGENMLLQAPGQSGKIATNPYRWLSSEQIAEWSSNNTPLSAIIGWDDWEKLTNDINWQNLVDSQLLSCGFVADVSLNNTLLAMLKNPQSKEKFQLFLATKPSNLPIGVYFPTFTDGRAYSVAAILRQDFGYQGALWAFGEVLVDQVLLMMRAGFDGAVLRHDQDADLALAQLSTFSVRMQDDWRQTRSTKSVASSTPQLWQIPLVAWDDRLEKKYQVLIQRCQSILATQQRIAFSSSLSVEDIVITHQLLTAKKSSVSQLLIFSLDTGYLPQETKEFLLEVGKFFAYDMPLISATSQEITELIAKDGEYAFYQNEEKKTNCCKTRKVIPLNRLLADYDAWITGQRQEQAITRSNLQFSAMANDQLTKFNPIFDWSENDVWAYCQHFHLPIHPLYQRGYASIGCEPCTRAIKAHESIRAGRWWWLDENKKECGLHPNSNPPAQLG